MEEQIISYAVTIGLVLGSALLAVLAFGGFRYGLAYLRSKMSNEQYLLLEAVASSVVRGLEQVGVTIPYTGEQKKELATSLLSRFAALYKLPVDDKLLNVLIESAVQIMNSDRFLLRTGEAQEG
jgi:Bacteriophage holin of superfamily 6 (Holin_LLH)